VIVWFSTRKVVAVGGVRRKSVVREVQCGQGGILHLTRRDR